MEVSDSPEFKVSNLFRHKKKYQFILQLDTLGQNFPTNVRYVFSFFIVFQLYMHRILLI